MASARTFYIVRNAPNSEDYYAIEIDYLNFNYLRADGPLAFSTVFPRFGQAGTRYEVEIMQHLDRQPDQNKLAETATWLQEALS